MWITVTVVMLLLIAAALWLLARATQVAEREQMDQRIGEPLSHQTASSDEAAREQGIAQVHNPLLRAICRHCWSAGFMVTPARVVQGFFLWLIFALLVSVVFGVYGPILAVAVVLGFWLFVAQRRRSRRRQINKQLPNYLGYVVRALTAGNTLEDGLYSAAMESHEPVRSVFLSVSRQVRLGASMEDTLAATARVHELRALHILAMSARVNRRYGGSMRRVIATLIETIQQQEAAARELKALTGETRFSAYVVAAIPIAISVFFYLQNPAYYATMLQSGGGRIAVVLALLLEAAGLAIIWRMMSRLQEPDA